MLGRRHDLVFGYNAARTHSTSARDDGLSDLRIPDAFNWDNNSFKPTVYKHLLDFDVEASQKILYGATVLRPTDSFAVILGGRLTDYSWEQKSAFSSGSRAGYGTTVDDKFIPYAGVTFDVDAPVSYTHLTLPTILLV